VTQCERFKQMMARYSIPAEIEAALQWTPRQPGGEESPDAGITDRALNLRVRQPYIPVMPTISTAIGPPVAYRPSVPKSSRLSMLTVWLAVVRAYRNCAFGGRLSLDTSMMVAR
jgi:hypothetical protein